MSEALCHLVYFTVSQRNVCLRLFPMFPATEGCFAIDSKYSTEWSERHTHPELVKLAASAWLREAP